MTKPDTVRSLRSTLRGVKRECSEDEEDAPSAHVAQRARHNEPAEALVKQEETKELSIKVLVIKVYRSNNEETLIETLRQLFDAIYEEDCNQAIQTRNQKSFTRAVDTLRLSRQWMTTWTL